VIVIIFEERKFVYVHSFTSKGADCQLV